MWEDERTEKALVLILAGAFLVSGLSAYQDLNFAFRGVTATATVTHVGQHTVVHHDRTSGTYRQRREQQKLIDLEWPGEDGTPRTGHVRVWQANFAWNTAQVGSRVAIRWIPGTSMVRAKSENGWVSLVVMIFCGLALTAYVGLQVLDRVGLSKKRRSRKSARLTAAAPTSEPATKPKKRRVIQPLKPLKSEADGD